jgi:hypothetical protein
MMHRAQAFAVCAAVAFLVAGCDDGTDAFEADCLCAPDAVGDGEAVRAVIWREDSCACQSPMTCIAVRDGDTFRLAIAYDPEPADCALRVCEVLLASCELGPLPPGSYELIVGASHRTAGRTVVVGGAGGAPEACVLGSAGTPEDGDFTACSP